MSNDGFYDCCYSYLEMDYDYLTTFERNPRLLIAYLSATHVDYFEGICGLFKLAMLQKQKG